MTLGVNAGTYNVLTYQYILTWCILMMIIIMCIIFYRLMSMMKNAPHTMFILGILLVHLACVNKINIQLLLLLLK